MLRKFLSLILAALTLLGVIASFSCSNQNTTADNTSVSDETSAEKPNTSPTTTPANTEETTAKSDASNPVNIAAKNSEGYIFESYSNWNYKTFVCPYTDGKGVVGGGEPGGHFEAADDEMAAFVTEKPEWYKDTKLMESWDSADAPFGDRIAEAAAADTPFISDKENVNGLMVYKTFDITDLSDDMLYSLNVYYDNTVYLYINGKLYFKNDANCGSGDWNGDYDTLNYNADTQKLTLKDFLVIGKNYIACYIKNCWGGRELDMELAYVKSSTKASTVFFEVNTDWHYNVFACPYTDGEGVVDGGASGGYFEEADDKMAAFIKDNPKFTTDTATLSTWPTANAPFGAAAQAIDWVGGNHGLILYKAFKVTDIEKLKKADYFDWYCAYDNAIHVYLNGTEIYTDDGECAVQDWNGGLTHYQLDTATIAPLLKEGENYFVVTIKDAWGGREFNAGFSAEWE